MNIVSQFLTNTRRYRDRPFVIDGDVSITFGEMGRRVQRLARGFQRLGLQPGETVGIFCRNRYEWTECFYAASLLGAVVCPINFRLVGKELNHVVNHSKTRVLVYDGPAAAELQRSVAGRAPAVRSYIHLDQPCPGVESIPYADVAAGAAEEDPDQGPLSAAGLRPDDPHMILYTSGTTGLPKGAVITHDNSLIGHFSNSLEWGIAPEDRILVASPLCHRTAFGRIVNAGGVGAAVVLMRSFRPEAAMELVERERITVMGMVPTMARMILRLPDLDRFRRDQVRAFVLTGEACPPPIKEGILAHFPNARIYTYFASTEGGMMTSLRPEDQIRKSLSVGHPVPGVELMVVDDEGKPVPAGEDGEIWARSGEPGRFIVMKEYLDAPEANAEVFQDGWFKTGDAGRFDEEGYLYVTDRKKDMILSGGLNIYSKEVENTIMEHPAVAEAAVVGVPDPDWGEAVMAFVAAVPGAELTAEEVIEFCRERLAGYKKPRYVRFVAELPKNSVGKVLKYVLREEGRRGLVDAG